MDALCCSWLDVVTFVSNNNNIVATMTTITSHLYVLLVSSLSHITLVQLQVLLVSLMPLAMYGTSLLCRYFIILLLPRSPVQLRSRVTF